MFLAELRARQRVQRWNVSAKLVRLLQRETPSSLSETLSHFNFLYQHGALIHHLHVTIKYNMVVVLFCQYTTSGVIFERMELAHKKLSTN